jgi:ABC-type transporter Mla subunit MlaD
MNKDRNALKAGTFIVVAVILSAAIVVAIKDFGHFAEATVVRSVRFKLADDLGGLRVGDEVRVGGFKVGSVLTVEPVNADNGQEAALVVTYSLPKKFVLREGAKVGVQSGLTGSTVMNIEDLGRGPVLADGAVVAGLADPKTRLFAQLGEVKFDETIAAFKKTADEATGTIADVRKKIDPAFDKYANVADRAGETMVNARDVLGESKTDLRGTFANLNAATTTVKDKLPQTIDNANAVLTKLQTTVDKVQGSLEKVQTALDDVKSTVSNAKDLSAGAKSVIVGNRSRLDAIVASLKTTGDNLKAASSEIRRSPWRLLYKPGKGEMANLNLYDSARQFAEGANNMTDAATALRDALASKDVDGKQIQALVEKLDKSFTSFQKVEGQLWERVTVRE